MFTLLGRGVSALVMLLAITAAGFAQVPVSQHVIIIIDENSSFNDVRAYMPWLVAEGNANGYATNYKSDNGGSLLDYLWLASGSCHSAANCTLPPRTHDFNCNGNDCYYPGTNESDPITDDNIFRLLNNTGVSWKVYAQSYALAGGTVTTPDNNKGTSYYRRHNGATWYSDVLGDVDGSAGKVVDLSQLAVDYGNGALPRYTIIVPDGNHDAHDCPVGMHTCTEAQKLAAADTFLKSTLTPILGMSDFQPGGTGLIFVTFDECGGGTDNGCGAAVYTAIIGPKVIPHTVSSMPYKHENTLRTMLNALGMTKYPGAAATAADMADFFVAEGDQPQVMIAAPANGAKGSSPVSLEASAIPSSGHTIGGWYVYVDGQAVYHTGAVDSINPSLALSNGKHTVLARAWDTSGAYGDRSVDVTAIAPQPFIVISTPTDDSDVGSPVNAIASASPSPGQTISGWEIYVDGVGEYKASEQTKIDANVAMSLGEHTILTRAWDTSGAHGDRTLILTVSAKPAVAVSAPLTGSNVISPISLQASATPSNGQTISGWYVYVDGVAEYHAGAVNSINANVSAANGVHTVIARAWDTSGAFGDQYLVLDTATVAVNISTPMNRAAVNSPVNIQASGQSTHQITGWRVYVDSQQVFAQDGGNSINANIPMGTGVHAAIVRAWDSTGAFGDQTIDVTVP